MCVLCFHLFYNSKSNYIQSMVVYASESIPFAEIFLEKTNNLLTRRVADAATGRTENTDAEKLRKSEVIYFSDLYFKHT